MPDPEATLPQVLPAPAAPVRRRRARPTSIALRSSLATPVAVLVSAARAGAAP